MDKPRIRVPAISRQMIVPEVETAHHAASRSARDMQSWQPIRVAPDTALSGELDTIVARAEDLARNNGLAQGAEQTHLDNIVGPGLRLVAMPDWRLLGKTKEWADEWADGVEALWRTYADNPLIDASQRLSFGGLTQLVFRTVLSAGEALALVLWFENNKSRWNTAIQLIDPARLSNPNGAQDTANLRQGVETDNFGAPVAYHIRKTHPGDFSTGIIGAGQWERVPVRLPFGRLRAIHVLPIERIGQSRAKPIVTAIMRQFKMLDHYEREELRTAVLHSMIMAFMETPLDQEGMAQALGGSDTDYYSQVAEWRVQMKGGAVVPTPPGTSIKPFVPTRPSGTFDAFVTAMMRHLAVGLNMPYELLAKDFSKTNYSSARAALLEAWRYFTGRRAWLGEYWAKPIYDLWLEEAVNRGYVEAPDFYAQRAAWTRCKWIGAGRGWIDPVKEAQAASVRMENNTSTLEIECAEQGLDWREVLEQRAREQEYARQLGVPLINQTVALDMSPADQGQAAA